MSLRRNWDKEFWRNFRVLRKRFPTMTMDDCRRRAYAMTEADHGPRPTGLKVALLELAWAFVKSGGNMDFSWMKNIWKGIRGALLVALGVAILTFLEAFDTADEVTAIGVPIWAAKLIVILVGALIPMLRNYFKMHRIKE